MEIKKNKNIYKSTFTTVYNSHLIAQKRNALVLYRKFIIFYFKKRALHDKIYRQHPIVQTELTFLLNRVYALIRLNWRDQFECLE